MDVSTYLWVTFCNGIIALGILFTGFWLIKVIVFGKDFNDVLREKGVSGGAIVLGCFIIGLSLVIAASSF